jgi:hypothetical protein
VKFAWIFSVICAIFAGKPKGCKNGGKCENASFRELPFAGRVKMVQKWSKSAKTQLLGMCDVTRHGRNYLLRAKLARFFKNASVGDRECD